MSWQEPRFADERRSAERFLQQAAHGHMPEQRGGGGGGGVGVLHAH